MNIDYVLVFAIFSIPRILSVRSKKGKRHETEESESGVDEGSEVYRVSELDLTGNIRRYFAVDVASADIKNNVVCSPVGAMLLLGKMAYGAEKSPTRNEMLDAIGIRRRARLGSSMRKIVKVLQFLSGVTLHMASNIFVSNKLKPNKEFVNKSSMTFTSVIQQVHCGHNSEITEINKWVCNNTKGKIWEILKTKHQICSQKSLIAVNGIYFKGEWQKPFIRSQLKNFYSMVGTVKIPMMIVNDIFNYGKTNIFNAHILEIPYKDSSTSFIIVLPYKKDGLPSVLEELKQNPTLLNLAIRTLKPRDVVLSIPKFKVTSEVDLKEFYKEMGVKTAMNPLTSGLSKIVENETLYISEAVQKVVLEVSETGTNEEFTQPKHVDPFYMDIDHVLFFANHPFLFYITTNREQLFAGIYNGVSSPLTNESLHDKC